MVRASKLQFLPPLHRAAALGDVFLVESLLADFTVEDSFRAWRPIEWACRYGQTEVVRFFLENGADGRVTNNVNDFCDSVYGPIHLAVIADSLPLVELLLSRGVPVDEGDLYSATPLHLARSAKMTRFLIPLMKQQARWGIEDENIEGLTPLHYAANSGRSSVLRCLLDASANPHHNDCEAGRPPIHRAAAKRHLKSCALLLEAGVDINAPDMYGRTALDEALTYAGWCAADRHISRAAVAAWMQQRGARATSFSDESHLRTIN